MRQRQKRKGLQRGGNNEAGRKRKESTRGRNSKIKNQKDKKKIYTSNREIQINSKVTPKKKRSHKQHNGRTKAKMENAEKDKTGTETKMEGLTIKINKGKRKPNQT